MAADFVRKTLMGYHQTTITNTGLRAVQSMPPEVRYKQVRQRISPGEAWRLQLMAWEFVRKSLMGYH